MTAEHVEDIKAVIQWMRDQNLLPVWLAGTSRGTQSVAYAATELSSPGGPAGIVLTSSILSDERSRPVPALPWGKVKIPVLVTHHQQDGCAECSPALLAPLMTKIQATSPKSELMVFDGGFNRGDPCGPNAYHGYNGIDRDVIAKIAGWILAN